MKASASAVRHGLDEPTVWGRFDPPVFPAAVSGAVVRYRGWRDPDDRRGEAKMRRRRYWKEMA